MFWEFLFSIIFTIITLAIWLIPIVSGGLLIGMCIRKNKTEEDKKQDDEFAPTCVAIFIFGLLVTLLFTFLTQKVWEETLDEYNHPCVQWSNPYSDGHLAQSAVCLKRKD